jgi:hypothetical protein
MDVLPLHDGLLIHRFIGSLDVAAILLIGVGGEWLYLNFQFLMLNFKFKVQNSTFNVPSVIAAVLLVVFLVPALRERREFYSLNRQWIERTRRALTADEDSRAIVAAVNELPPGRVYAGLRANWGKELAFGDVHFYDLLTFNRVPAVSPPYSDMSLNADLIWHFDDRNAAHYDLFNVKYVIAPRGWPAAEFLQVVKQTPRYTLYRAGASGYADFVAVAARRSPPSQPALFYQNLDWFQGGGPAQKRALRYDYPARAPAAPAENRARCPDGRITERSVAPGRIEFDAACAAAADIAIKMTYHPNWRVMIGGRETPTFMLSPSFIGFELPPGGHRVVAEYRGSPLKFPLLVFGAITLAAVFVFRRRLEGVKLLTAK